jgi:hypothetical protein
MRPPREVGPAKDIAAHLYVHPRVRTHKESAAVAQAQSRPSEAQEARAGSVPV